MEMWFDRKVSKELMSVLEDHAPHELVDLARERSGAPLMLDLQLRADLKQHTSWATLYYGLTSILNVEERDGAVRLTAHETHRQRGEFDDAWSTWQSPDALDAAWPQVSAYLKRIQGLVDARWTGKEGGVHAALSSGSSDAYRIINREVSPAFSSEPVKHSRMAQWREPLTQCLQQVTDAAWPWPSTVSVGTSPDFLAVDIGGRLAVIEAKHHSATSMIAKVPVQVAFYARMYRALLVEDQDAVEDMEAMLQQRVALQLSRPGVLYLTRRRQVVPVIAIGPQRPSQEARRRLWEVAAVLEPALGDGVDPLELWYLDDKGRIDQVERPADLS